MTRSLNLFLVAVVGLGFWQVRRNHERAELRERALATAAVPVTATIAVPPIATTPKAQPVQYADIALRSLFSPDRHPHVAADPPPQPAPQPPVPAFPRAHGVVDLGSGPVVLLSLNGERQRPYQPGETLGPWKLQSIAGERLVFEWAEQGRVFEKTLGELRPPQTAVTAEAASPIPNLKPHREELTGDGPGPPTGLHHRVCKSGDRSPVGTVVDGFRKVESPTPFGNVCRWERATGGQG